MSLAMFVLDGEQLVPTPISLSMWSPNQMHGIAVSGALARSLESRLSALGRTDLRPARYTVDLFRPATMAPCTVETDLVREGKRICLIDSILLQGGEPVARASCTFLLPTTSPNGAVWTPTDHAEPPSLEVAPPSEEPGIPYLASELPWSQSFREHQNAGRKRTWQVGLPVVEGEAGTPFQAAASIADATSMVLNWGTEGVQFINTDITLTLARQPVGREIGLAATTRVEHDGIAVGTAEVFDRAGPLGTAMVSSIANAARPVSFDNVEFDDEGGRHVG